MSASYLGHPGDAVIPEILGILLNKLTPGTPASSGISASSLN